VDKLVDGQRCESGCKRESTMKYYRMSLVTSLILKLEADQRIDGDGLWSCLSFTTGIKVCRQMGLDMERNGCGGEQWNGQDDFLIFYIFLCFV